MICIEIPRSDRQGESNIDDDDVHYYIGERLKLERETENSGVRAEKREASKLWSYRSKGRRRVTAFERRSRKE